MWESSLGMLLALESIVGESGSKGGVRIRRRQRLYSNEFRVPHPTYIPTTRSLIVANLVRADTRRGRSLGHVPER